MVRAEGCDWCNCDVTKTSCFVVLFCFFFNKLSSLDEYDISFAVAHIRSSSEQTQQWVKHITVEHISSESLMDKKKCVCMRVNLCGISVKLLTPQTCCHRRFLAEHENNTHGWADAKCSSSEAARNFSTSRIRLPQLLPQQRSVSELRFTAHVETMTPSLH